MGAFDYKPPTDPSGAARPAPDPDSVSLATLLERVQFGKRTTIDIAKDGKSIEVTARRLLPEEPRDHVPAESPPRAHVFLSAASFGDYLARYGRRETVVFADEANQRISAVLHERQFGDADDSRDEGGFEVIAMTPQEHPLWTPWATLPDQKMAIRDFAAFVAQHRRSIVQPSGRELALSLSQIRASVSIEAQTGRGRNAINGLMVRTKIAGGGEQADPVDLPDAITVRCPLFVDTEPKDVELDLCIESDSSGEVSVSVSEGTVAEAKTAAFEDMVRVIREKTAHLEMVVTHGRPMFGSWSYLHEMPNR